MVTGGGDPMLAAMKRLSKQLVHTEFKEPWQFRVEIEGAPDDWDLYCKEVTHTPIELETNSKRVGAHYLNYLNGSQTLPMSFTMRDNENGDIHAWFEEWVGQVVHSDGTWGVPIDYLRTVKLFGRTRDGGEYLRKERRVQPISIGETTETVERSGTLLEFPITVMEFRGGETNY